MTFTRIYYCTAKAVGEKHGYFPSIYLVANAICDMIYIKEMPFLWGGIRLQPFLKYCHFLDHKKIVV